MSNDRAPVYLSARSADVILSEIRPTRLKGDALQSINGFLDELLFLVVQTARSLSPPRLKDGLLKLLPTPLGKEAVLEAEMELRSHRDPGVPSTPALQDDASSKDFPVQAAYELLRLKCEACTTFNEMDDEADGDAKLLAKLTASPAIRTATIQSAVYYATAILEHMCQHILSSVGRVVARDSSRTVATSHDLYVALCEDETIYSLFSNMKIYETINSQSTLAKPRRSKSFSQSNDSQRNTSSPIPGQDGRTSRASDATSARTSFEKARALRLFKSSDSVNGHDSTLPPVPHKRSQSQASTSVEKHGGRDSYDDDSSPASQDFDDHLKSGETMKFSLTPDRLQSMESFRQQKAQRGHNPVNGNRSGPGSPTTQSTPSSPPNRSTINGRGHRNRVEAIDEGDEDSPPSMNSRSPPKVNGAAPPTNGWVAPPPRSQSKNPFGEPVGLTLSMPEKHRPARTHKNRESLDLDDVMNGLDDESFSKPALTPKTPTAARSSARDLMEFLADGPPDECGPNRSLSFSGGPISSADQRKGGGRFKSIVSRLRNRSSTERLPGSISEVSTNETRLRSKSSATGLQNYPRPPRYNAVSSPPTSFNGTVEPVKETQSLPARSRVSSTPRKAVPEWNSDNTEGEDEHFISQPPPEGPKPTRTAVSPIKTAGISPVSAAVNGHSYPSEILHKGEAFHARPTTPPASVKVASSVSPKSATVLHSKPHTDFSKVPITKESALELRQLLCRAETASECRLLVDMFLAKQGLSSTATGVKQPVVKDPPTHNYGDLQENRLLDMLLGSA